MASIIGVICKMFGIIRIDRSTPIDLAKFMGGGCSVWRGPADGDGLSGDEEQDKRSLALTRVSISKILLETFLKKGERSIERNEMIGRLKTSGRIRLDAKILQTLWKNKHCIPERWKERKDGRITYISFDGTVLRSSLGRRYVLCVYWDAFKWNLGCSWLVDDWRASNRSAVL